MLYDKIIPTIFFIYIESKMRTIVTPLNTKHLVNFESFYKITCYKILNSI